MAEKKIMDIEEELKIVGANMQTLEMSEEKTMKREEGLQEEILELRYLDHDDDNKGRYKIMVKSGNLPWRDWS